MHTGALLLLSLSGENTFLKMKLIKTIAKPLNQTEIYKCMLKLCKFT